MTMVRKIAISALLGSAFTTSAFAADIAQPVSSWTGWHVGAGVGYGMVNHEIGVAVPAEPAGGDFSGIGGEGGLATLEAGYDVEVGSNFVLGALFDYTFSNINTNGSAYVDGLGSGDYKLQASHAISAIVRGGRLVNDHTLMYSLVGWTRTWWNGDLNIYDDTGAPVTIPGVDTSYEYATNGLTLGGGIESAIADNTTLKLEYRYTMNAEKSIFTDPDFSIDENANVHTARMVLSYRPGVMGKDFDGSEERWTGLRAGLGGGYSMINHELAAAATNGDFDVDFSGIGGEGFFGTVEVGYDMLFGDRFVAGVQADYSYSTASTDLDGFIGTGSGSYELEATHSASALLRAGILSSPDVLWYGIAGYTHTWFNADYSLSDPPFTESGSYDFDKGGLTVGAGVEVMLSDAWSWKTEYRYTSVGDIDIIDDPDFYVTASPNIQQVRSVLTYRF